MKPNINLLKTIKPIDAPPHLYAQIQKRIRAIEKECFSPVITMAWSMAAVLVLVLNIWVVLQTNLWTTDYNAQPVLSQVFIISSSSNDIYQNE